jgi:hypothetical protein
MDFELQIMEPQLRRLYLLWRERSRAGAVPTRADLDPVTIPGDLLPSIFIYERHGSRFFCRLAGTGLRTILGYEPSGRFADEMGPKDQAGTRAQLMDRVLESEIPAYATGSLAINGREGPPMGQLFLPVASRPGRADQIFGALGVSSQVRPPSRGDVRGFGRMAAVAWHPAA